MDKTINSAKKYAEKYETRLSQNEKDLLDELIDKLIHIGDLDPQINRLNQECLNFPRFDSKTDTLLFGGVSIKLKRKDLDKEITMSPIAAGYTKGSGGSGLFSKENREKQRELERLTTLFYEYAHRIIKICKKMPDLESFKCNEITFVRNKLVQHPEERGVFLDSFAYDRDKGPIIKGTRYTRQVNTFPSNGYRSDFSTFITQLTEKFNSALSNKNN